MSINSFKLEIAIRTHRKMEAVSSTVAGQNREQVKNITVTVLLQNCNCFSGFSVFVPNSTAKITTGFYSETVLIVTGMPIRKIDLLRLFSFSQFE